MLEKLAWFFAFKDIEQIKQSVATAIITAALIGLGSGVFRLVHWRYQAMLKRRRKCIRCKKTVPPWFGTPQYADYFLDEEDRPFLCARCGEEKIFTYPAFWNRVSLRFKVFRRHRQIRKALLLSPLPKKSEDEVRKLQEKSKEELKDIYGYDVGNKNNKGKA